MPQPEVAAGHGASSAATATSRRHACGGACALAALLCAGVYLAHIRNRLAGAAPTPRRATHAHAQSTHVHPHERAPAAVSATATVAGPREPVAQKSTPCTPPHGVQPREHLGGRGATGAAPNVVMLIVDECVAAHNNSCAAPCMPLPLSAHVRACHANGLGHMAVVRGSTRPAHRTLRGYIQSCTHMRCCVKPPETCPVMCHAHARTRAHMATRTAFGRPLTCGAYMRPPTVCRRQRLPVWGTP